MKKHDLIRRKREVLERPEPPGSWVPKEFGESVAGIVESIATGRTKLDQDVPVLALRDVESGESKSVWMMGAILEDAYRKRGIKVGDWLCIKFLGMRPGRRGNSYKAFDIEHVAAKDIEPDVEDSGSEAGDEWLADPDADDEPSPRLGADGLTMPRVEQG